MTHKKTRNKKYKINKRGSQKRYRKRGGSDQEPSVAPTPAPAPAPPTSFMSTVMSVPGRVFTGAKNIVTIPITASKAVFVKVLDTVGNVVNLDLTDKAKLDAKLTQFNEILKDPRIREEIKKSTGILADQAVLVVQAGQPAFIELSNKVGDVMKVTIPKLVDDLVTIGLNILEALPGTGVVIGLLRDIDKGSRVIETSLETWFDLLIAANDTFKKTKENLKAIASTVPSKTLVPSLPSPSPTSSPAPTTTTTPVPATTTTPTDPTTTTAEEKPVEVEPTTSPVPATSTAEETPVEVEPSEPTNKQEGGKKKRQKRRKYNRDYYLDKISCSLNDFYKTNKCG
jgi:hypothetical protein